MFIVPCPDAGLQLADPKWSDLDDAERDIAALAISLDALQPLQW